MDRFFFMCIEKRLRENVLLLWYGILMRLVLLCGSSCIFETFFVLCVCVFVCVCSYIIAVFYVVKFVNNS